MKETDQQQVFSLWAILLGAFVGGPLAVGYFLANNFEVLGEGEKARPSLKVAVLSTIVFLTITIVLNIPIGLLGFGCVGVSFAIFQYYQSTKLTAFVQAGGQAFGWGRIIGVSLISLCITLLPLMIWTLLVPNNQDIQIQTYGTTVKHQIAFRADNLTIAEVNKVATVLEKVSFFDEAVPKNLYLTKQQNQYILSIFVQQEIVASKEVGQLFEYLKISLSEALPNHQITQIGRAHV